MFEPFRNNYVWNLSVNLALCMGGAIGEIDSANRVILSAAAEGEDAGTEAFFASWCALADRLAALGKSEAAAGRARSATEKLRRAIVYYMIAERMQSRHFAPREQAYRKMLDTMALAVGLGELNCERVEIPFDSAGFPGLFVRGAGDGPRPCMVHCNGLDSVKEMIYWSGIGEELSRRGISTLMIDHPGVGEALRLHQLHAIVESERWAGAALDYLERRPDVRSDRIGMMGWSLGGYYAPRAVAFEPRFKLCVAWGANHNWGELQRLRLAREGERPVPHYWDHVLWVWGQENLEQFLELARRITLVGIVEQIKVPFLITHGAGDRQIPVRDAQQSFEAAIRSPKRELKIFTAEEGGVEHCSADNMEPVRSYIADWIATAFDELSIAA